MKMNVSKARSYGNEDINIYDASGKEATLAC